jgi:hypothetical protein
MNSRRLMSDMGFLPHRPTSRRQRSRRRYRPELHYMRGPGPKWFERHGR